MERLISSLAEEDISTITLFAESKVVSLYEKLGFQKDPAGIRVRLVSVCSRTGITAVKSLSITDSAMHLCDLSICDT